MNLKSQCCSLDLAKRLKELNVKQESLFYWIKNMGGEIITHNFKRHFTQCPCPTLFESTIKYIDDNEIYSAFTVSELVELLPIRIIHENDAYFYSIYPPSLMKNIWLCEYKSYDENRMQKQTRFIKCDETIANVCAKMLIYLLENGLIKNEINPKD